MIALVQHKKINITFSTGKTKFCLSLHYSGDEGYLHVNKTEICKFKVDDNINWCHFWPESMSKDFIKDKRSDISLNGTP